MIYVRLKYYDCFDEKNAKNQCFSIELWKDGKPVNWKNTYFKQELIFSDIEQKSIFAQLAKDWFLSGEIDLDTLQMIDFEIAEF